MPRPPRVEEPGGLYHVTTRGNDRRAIVADDLDRYTWLGTAATVVARHGWICHAYCLMTNHYHLLVETPFANLALGMCQLNGFYSRRFNRRHRRTDHVFGRRYGAEAVHRERHLVGTARYIVLNPVRAGICRDPAEWGWSSYRATAGQEPPSTFLTVDWLLGFFGRDRESARVAYAAFVEAGIEGQRPSSPAVARPA